MNEKSTPSIFRLNFLELVLGILIGVLMIMSFHHNLASLEPWGYFGDPSEAYPGWFVNARGDLSQDYGWFFFLLGFLATVSLIRFVRQQNHLVSYLGQVSPKGYLILIWPLLFLIPEFHFIFSALFYAWCALVIAIFAIISVITIKQQNIKGDMLPALLNLVHR